MSENHHMDNIGQKTKLIEVFTFLAVCANIFATVFLYLKYEARFLKSSADLAEVNREIAKQTLISNQIEKEYLKPIKDQQLSLNDLDLVTKELLIEKEKYQKQINKISIKEESTPSVIISANLSELGSFTTDGVYQKLISPRVSIQNETIHDAFIDATYTKILKAQFPKEWYTSQSTKVINKPNETGSVQWDVVFEKLESSEFFPDNQSKYDFSEKLPDQKKWKKHFLKDDQYLTGDLNKLFPRSDYQTLLIPCQRFFILRMKVHVFFRYENHNNETEFRVRSFITESYYLKK
jgi:hypothetical protein